MPARGVLQRSPVGFLRCVGLTNRNSECRWGWLAMTVLVLRLCAHLLAPVFFEGREIDMTRFDS